jgi:4-alpha-glucanotransferase
VNGSSPQLSGRRAGVLLHVGSLPARTIGADARRFVDLLAKCGFSVWQVLPLGPVDPTGSPYQLSSAFAGECQWLDRDDLRDESWWPSEDPMPDDARSLVDEAWAHFRRHASSADWEEFAGFRRSNSAWLLPYAMYVTLKRLHEGRPWWEWPAEYRTRQRGAISDLLDEHGLSINATAFGQYVFARQWQALRDYAQERAVSLFGDLPFYVDRDSADAWWRREVFRLGPDGDADFVSGVPPDYFNADGQRWGNPLYDWEYLQRKGFNWWLSRLRSQAQRFDLLRIDHFRALESCWAIPVDSPTARDGHWETVPGDELLTEALRLNPDCALVAEDLGTITDEVRALRDRFGLPGMLVLQFAFDGSPDNPYLPANHVENAVVYTGTHDNDTTAGWYASLDDQARTHVDAVIGQPQAPVAAAGAMVKTACASPAKLAMIPFQDLLGLGSDARMNTPGTVGGNWQWRFAWSDLDGQLASQTARLLDTTGRRGEGLRGEAA